MKITILGATGNVGKRIVNEALLRGHKVTGVVRDINKDTELKDKITLLQGDASLVDDVIKVSQGQDVVVNAIRPTPDKYDSVAKTTRTILDGLSQTGVRLIISGGAASLKVPGKNGLKVLDDPTFLSVKAKNIGKASLAQYVTCLDEKQVDWVYVSPPANLVPGTRSGKYKSGKNELLVDENGKSEISMEDLAVAILDEIENPKHHQTRFTVSSETYIS